MKLQPSYSPSNLINEYSLLQNYPNPFNPSSRITFSLPEASYTQLKVNDVFGRDVRTPVSEVLPEGTHNYEFNGKNLASGVYFYTLKAGNHISTKKMILSK
jgi:hypothetical protein